MSLYQVQKFLFNLNRDEQCKEQYTNDKTTLLRSYDLTDDETEALSQGDIGLLYVMGVNGQILMHYSALIGQEWDEYIHAMKEGVKSYGPVRAGLYSMLKDREP